MPRAMCDSKNCIYYDETEQDRCQLDSIRIKDGECSDHEEEHRQVVGASVPLD